MNDYVQMLKVNQLQLKFIEENDWVLQEMPDIMENTLTKIMNIQLYIAINSVATFLFILGGMGVYRGEKERSRNG